MDTSCKSPLVVLFSGLCCVIAMLSGVVLGSIFGRLHAYVFSIEWAMPISQANASKHHEQSRKYLLLAQDKTVSASPAEVKTVSTTPVSVETSIRPTNVDTRQKKYTSYTVQPHEMLSKLDPEGWQHTCKVNQQIGRIRNDCRLIAYVTILLPVAVVAGLESKERMVAQHQSNGNASRQSLDSSPDSSMRIARTQPQFCDHAGTQEMRLTVCSSERSSQTEQQRLALK